jgi:hypothetical protein
MEKMINGTKVRKKFPAPQKRKKWEKRKKKKEKKEKKIGSQERNFKAVHLRK